MKVGVWYAATHRNWKTNFSVIVKRVDDSEVWSYGDAGGMLSYRIVIYSKQDDICHLVPDTWDLRELSGLELELL